jgi:hypothetical protein
MARGWFRLILKPVWLKPSAVRSGGGDPVVGDLLGCDA